MCVPMLISVNHTTSHVYIRATWDDRYLADSAGVQRDENMLWPCENPVEMLQESSGMETAVTGGDENNCCGIHAGI